ncbi:MAG: polyphenol oxidase family protein [Acidimicrobiia bacterium]
MIELVLGRARAVWTDRRGGVSEPPYDRANLSLRCGDDTAAVLENRGRVADALRVEPPEQWWWLDQEHGRTAVVAAGPPPREGVVADAAVTTQTGVPLVVLTADCAPIALACDDAAGVVHAGWQGLLAGVIEEAVATLRAIGSGEVQAALGPCIHPARYEFGPAELDRVIARLGPSVEARAASGSPALDLPAAVRLALERAGVTAFTDVDVCTSTSSNHFSHRRDGETGRQGLVVVLDP